jgi:hypothetical protein
LPVVILAVDTIINRVNVGKISMVMRLKDCQVFVGALIKNIEKNLLDNATLNFDGTPIVPRVQMDKKRSEVNATLYPAAGGYGVEVTELLLEPFVPDAAIKFSIAHELGHAFSAPLLNKMCIPVHQVVLAPLATLGNDDQLRTGAPTEVIADLGAAYMLNLMGVKWSSIVEVGDHGAEIGIFDMVWNGQHPPGVQRADCIRSFVKLMEEGFPFELAAKGVCLSMIGAGPVK